MGLTYCIVARLTKRVYPFLDPKSVKRIMRKSRRDIWISHSWIGRVCSLEHCNWMGDLRSNVFLDLSIPTLKAETAWLPNQLTVVNFNLTLEYTTLNTHLTVNDEIIKLLR
jgi:hypothetical protein